jgi:cell division protein FtsN
MRNLNRQHGGTILGIIIGLVIGLGIALTVAVVITKTPMPFTDRGIRLKSGEPTAGQSADPNRPLYGKQVETEVVRNTPPNTTLPEPGNPRPEVTVGSARDGRPPVVELSAPSSYKAPAARNADDPWRYFLQAGAFRGRPDAESMRGRLALEGVDASISEYQSDNGLLYRVRIGPFDQLTAMNRVRGKLSDNGVDAAVVRVAK